MKKTLLSLLMILALLTGCAPSGGSSAPEEGEGTQSSSSVQPVPTPEPEPEPEPEPTVVRLMAAGDVMSHMPITNDAFVAASGTYSFAHMLQDAAEQLSGADYALANLETPLAGGPDYSGYPTFNAPDSLASDLRAAGFDLLSTANNHSLDRGTRGVYRTLDVLEQEGLAHAGTYRSQEERDASSGVYVADVGGVSVAFLSYTYGLNGFRLPQGEEYAVNLFNLDYYTTLSDPDYDRLQADLEAARALDADLIAVIIHWGVEYQNAPNTYQTNMARFLVEQGADLVLGSHPHVLQPYETISVTGWDGRERQGFVCYSLGNFISNQQDLETRTTAVLELELTRDPGTGETSLTHVSYLPYYMVHRNGQPAGQQRYLVNIHQTLADQEVDGLPLTAAETQELQAALEHCHAILGAEDDRGAAGP